MGVHIATLNSNALDLKYMLSTKTQITGNSGL